MSTESSTVTTGDQRFARVVSEKNGVLKMFYCEKCAEEKKWPFYYGQPVSFGACEVCGKSNLCADVPHRPAAQQTPEPTVPDYLAQTGEALSGEDRHHWMVARVAEAKAEGVSHMRASVNRDPNLLLVEGWKTKPENEGDPRFQFAAAS